MHSLFSLITSVAQPSVLEASMNENSDVKARTFIARGAKTPGRDGKLKMRSMSQQPTPTATSPRYVQLMTRFFYGPTKLSRTLPEEAEQGDEEAVNTWIRDGVNPNEADAYGYTPILNAATIGRVHAVEHLIKNGANVNMKGPFGYTPLHAAAQYGRRECVALLLENGADINAQNDEKDTPMHLAVQTQQMEIIYMLMRAGANTKILGLQNKDCVTLAKELGMNDLSRSLKNYTPAIGRHAHSEMVMKRHRKVSVIYL